MKIGNNPITPASVEFIEKMKKDYDRLDRTTPFKLKLWRNGVVDNIYFSEKKEAFMYADLSMADQLILTQFKPKIKILRYRFRSPFQKQF